MDIRQYLIKLRRWLSVYYQRSDRNDIIDYYTELFESEGYHDVLDLVEAFGTARILAKKIAVEDKRSDLPSVIGNVLRSDESIFLIITVFSWWLFNIFNRISLDYFFLAIGFQSIYCAYTYNLNRKFLLYGYLQKNLILLFPLLFVLQVLFVIIFAETTINPDSWLIYPGFPKHITMESTLL